MRAMERQPERARHAARDGPAAVPPRRWSEGRIAAALFLGLWLTYAFLVPGPQLGNSNSVSRTGLDFAIARHAALTIDEVAPHTIDKALRDGAYYSDKAPGTSLTALPIVAAAV